MNLCTAVIALPNTVKIVIDIIAVILILFIVYAFVLRKKPSGRSIATIIAAIVLGIAGYLFGLELVYYVAGIVGIAAIVLIANSTLRFNSKKAEVKENKHTISSETEREQFVNNIVQTLEYFSARKVGAIITFEKNINLNIYINKAIQIDGVVSQELLKTIFFPNTALHDGAVIIRGDHVACAAAYFPLTDKSDIPSYYGTRHRAAIGISEETDAFSVVVSEETGTISYTIGGTITSGVSEEALKEAIHQNIFAE